MDLGSCGATAPDSALHVMTDMLGNCGINSFRDLGVPITWEARGSRQDLSLGWEEMSKAEFGSESLKKKVKSQEAVIT